MSTQNLIGFGAYRYDYPQNQPLLKVEELAAPGIAVYRHAGSRPMAGLGSNGGAATAAIAMWGGLILVAGAINYQLGKAMAPSKADESKWAWGGAIGGTIFPPVLLGMAVAKNYFI